MLCNLIFIKSLFFIQIKKFEIKVIIALEKHDEMKLNKIGG